MEKLAALFFFSALLGNSCEDDITANRAAVFSAEGQTVSLSCNYSVKAENLQWYRQDPGSAPHYLLMITDTKEPEVLKAAAVNSRLTAELNQERNQVYLQINSAAVTDSAVYYCAVRPTVTGNTTTLYKNTTSTRGSINCEELTPVKTEEFTSEHTSVSLSYNFFREAAFSDDFFWYRQHPGKPPDFLMSHSGPGETVSALVSGLSVTVSDDKRKINLQINSAAVTDSAVYYCAVRPTVTGNTTTLYKNTTSTRGSHTLLHLSGFL
ncbi:T cell receptor alpha chain [Solea senegalensis]|nr:T cell receptor alpha chain [Solea senegalensis]